jgi:hypothetical protein
VFITTGVPIGTVVALIKRYFELLNSKKNRNERRISGFGVTLESEVMSARKHSLTVFQAAPIPVGVVE